MTAGSSSLSNDLGALLALLGLAALGVSLVLLLGRRRAPASGTAVREFLVDYHQIQHETYEQRRPFTRLRTWVQAQVAGLAPAAAEFESAVQEFLTLGLDGVRRFGENARSLHVERSIVSRLDEETARLETALRTALTRDGKDRIALAHEVVRRMEKVSAACLEAYLQIANRAPCRAGPEVRLV